MPPMPPSALVWSRTVSGTSSPQLVSQSVISSISGVWAARMSSDSCLASGSEWPAGRQVQVIAEQPLEFSNEFGMDVTADAAWIPVIRQPQIVRVRLRSEP